MGANSRLRFAVCSCSNYQFGIFHAYRRIAERTDLNAVIHLGDYIYEFQNGYYGSFRNSEPSTEILTQTAALGDRVRSLSADVSQVDRDVAKFQSVRRELEETNQTARDISTRFSQVEAARQTVEAALRDFEQLKAVHATVNDSLEQAQLAHGEIARLREGQSEARSWMSGVEQSVKELKDQVADVNRFAPTIEVAQKQAQRLSESLSDIERRRGLVDNLQRLYAF